MGKVLDKFYARYENPGVLGIILDRGMPIDWAIEAGCHDGTDTLRIASMPNMKAIFAFEPDSVAADIAEAKFLGLSKMITLVRSALWSKPGIVEMYSPTGKPGDGNSIFNFVPRAKTTPRSSKLHFLAQQSISKLRHILQADYCGLMLKEFLTLFYKEPPPPLKILLSLKSKSKCIKCRIFVLVLSFKSTR
jgi:hypothetical protein